MMRFLGKNAIITGARTGIGLACVEKFAREGANVWAIVHREDQEWLAAMEQLAAETGVWIRPIYIDLSDEQAIKEGITAIIREKQPIDILVNAAGVTSPSRLIQMTSLDDMRSVMQVNFFAAVQIAQLVSRVMCRQKSGAIVNVASIAGLDGDLAQLEYAASKAALICATKKMAYEWGQFGIRVNAVAPGVIATKMVDDLDNGVRQEWIHRNTLSREGTPQEVASAIAFLASGDATYLSGQTLRIDGGGISYFSTLRDKGASEVSLM